ncbi:tRNA (guanosine(46)-N7)-methyltransferase TrmB [Plantactinospora siamensis]|uniref:tRNA (guanine-N(7)-)-methyltransferase n=1 Tax=Plantactinospora siamensis TaxID=555372 RepID=A0ABV6P0S0_9ACTN
MPDDPAGHGGPDEPSDPGQPAGPGSPGQPAGPDEPAGPGGPGQPERPAQPGRPAQPDQSGGGIELAELFGRNAPLVLEIGSGMGDVTAAMAAADPDRDYLAVEVHTPGIANLLAMVERRGLRNVRVADGDALVLLRHVIPPGAFAAINIFFPDPWPKARHHKRRLIQPAHVPLLRDRLAPGGRLHCATDLPDYAYAMRETLTADPELVNAYPGFAPRPDRPVTKFERRARAAHRAVYDLIFERKGPVPGGTPS